MKAFETEKAIIVQAGIRCDIVRLEGLGLKEFWVICGLRTYKYFADYDWFPVLLDKGQEEDFIVVGR